MMIECWKTRDARTCFQAAGPIPFLRSDPRSDRVTIAVDRGRRYQEIDGFGFALTGGSASLIAALAPDVRANLLAELFGSSENSIGLSCLRLSIGASDLSRASFSYCDVGGGRADLDLGDFDLFAGDVEIVPVLREILAINPGLMIMATPWSAPPWMKTNGSFIGGELRAEYQAAYASYFVRYIRAMRQNGIRIAAVTPQNEPRNTKNEPSMAMSAGQQIEFVRDHLGPALAAEAPETGIFCWDHNCDDPGYPLAVLEDRHARKFVRGVAWHLYAGSPEALSIVHARYPDQKMYLTEQWVSAKGDFKLDLRWHMRKVVIGVIRNWGRLVLEWNLAADENCGPHTPAGAFESLGGITIGRTLGRNVGYYIMAHTAKFIRPGSVRIHSTDLVELPNVACLTPDGRIVLIVLNDGDAAKEFDIGYEGMLATVQLEAGSVATLLWGGLG